MKNKILSTVAGLLLGALCWLFIINTQGAQAQSSQPTARIDFYPCNGADRQSYVAYGSLTVTEGNIRFKNQSGNSIILSGSYVIVELK